ncbi:MAG: hypothetical protein V3W36_06815 [Acidimicrobiia bacterium]
MMLHEVSTSAAGIQGRRDPSRVIVDAGRTVVADLFAATRQIVAVAPARRNTSVTETVGGGDLSPARRVTDSPDGGRYV